MLNHESILLDVEANNAEHAIRLSGELLFNMGASTAGYIDAMVKNWKDNGAYFVIAPGLALPHARPEQGALVPQISVVRLTKPVKFGSQENDPVSLIIGLAATNSDQHVQLIQRVAQVLCDESQYKILNNAQDANSIVDLFS